MFIYSASAFVGGHWREFVVIISRDHNASLGLILFVVCLIPWRTAKYGEYTCFRESDSCRQAYMTRCVWRPISITNCIWIDCIWPSILCNGTIVEHTFSGKLHANVGCERAAVTLTLVITLNIFPSPSARPRPPAKSAKKRILR